MSIKWMCPSCNNKLVAQDRAVGKRIKCPRCGTEIGVPVSVPPAEKPQHATRPTEPPEASAPSRAPWVVAAVALLAAGLLGVLALGGRSKALALQAELEQAEHDREEATVASRAATSRARAADVSSQEATRRLAELVGEHKKLEQRLHGVEEGKAAAAHAAGGLEQRLSSSEQRVEKLRAENADLKARLTRAEKESKDAVAAAARARELLARAEQRAKKAEAARAPTPGDPGGARRMLGAPRKGCWGSGNWGAGSGNSARTAT